MISWSISSACRCRMTPTSAPKLPGRRAELVAHLREQGRANLRVLRRVRSALAADGKQRSLVRIFDAVLWLAHPGAVLPGAERVISVPLR
jgi:hypothetical protein